jgi:hypothetical protein
LAVGSSFFYTKALADFALSAASAAAVLTVFVLSTAPPSGFKDGSNPGLGAAITAVSPAVIGGGAPCPAHIAALDFISSALS